jgi:GntR family transcriptional regulator of vanillate catabolism
MSDGGRDAVVRQHVVVERLREMILAGDIGGGERLLEIPLAEQLNVSRTPVREALIILAEDGLVEYRPNRGYVVRTFTLQYIMDAYIVREALEAVAARLAAERGIDSVTYDKMEALLQEGDRILDYGGLKEESRAPLREINDRFHQSILQAAGNAVMEQALSVATNIPYSSSRVAHWYQEDDREGLFQLRAFHAQHHSILAAIKGREGYRAETIMRAHISGAAEGIRNQLLHDGSDLAGSASVEEIRAVG